MVETQKAVETNKKFYLSWSLHDTDVRLEGIRIGEKRGKKEGMNEAKIASARNMLARKYPVNDIADITGLSVKKIEELAAEMAKEATL